MVKEFIENGEKIVRVAEDIQFSGTITTIMAIMLLVILCFIIFWGSKGAKQLIVTMKEFGHATKEMAESIRALVDENIKKDETSQRNIDEFNNVRRLHIEEIKRVTEMACNVDKTLEKVVVKLDIMDGDNKEIKAMLKVK